MKKDVIILMGGQGVGKGTFAQMLRNSHEYNYIETGALFRALPADSDIAKLIAAGILVPDERLFELVASKLSDTDDSLIDGFPRTLAQAQWFIENYANKYNVHIVHLNVPEEIMLARIQKRLNEGGGRADDTDAAAVRRRLDTFWNKTMPAIEWMKVCSNINFADIDVTSTVDENFARIQEALKK